MNDSRARAPLAVEAREIAPRSKPSNYPEPYFSRMAKREKRQLGDVFGLTSFGVNLTRLEPGGESALMHRHTRQQEFVYILEGHPTLVTEDNEVTLSPGMCAGFTPCGASHHLVNRTGEAVVLLEIGDRVEGDEASYPNDDIQAVMDAAGKWCFTHKDGRPYE